MLSSMINLIKRKLENQLGLFHSSANGKGLSGADTCTGR